VQLADGRQVLDLVSGIGPYVFGHDDQDLLETAAIAAAADVAFDGLAERLPGVVTTRSGLGGMQGFVAWRGDPAITQEIVVASLEEGVLFQTAGSDPMKIRLLPPLTLTDEELEAGFAALERALRRVAEQHGLALESVGATAARQDRI